MNARVLFKHLLAPTFALLIPRFRSLRDRDRHCRLKIPTLLVITLFFEVWNYVKRKIRAKTPKIVMSRRGWSFGRFSPTRFF